jgi:hypothetical protein
MKRPTDRILPTHAGSLPRADDLRQLVLARAGGQPYDKAALAGRLRSGVAEVVGRQVECGLHSVNDGELSKTNFTNYVRERLSGFVSRPYTPGVGPAPLSIAGRDLLEFPEYFAAGLGGFAGSGPSRAQVFRVEPLKYVGHGALAEDLANFKAALRGVRVDEAFVSANTPGAPMIDYATGTMGAFAISAALYQRLRTGRGQYIDMAMFDVAMILQGPQITDFLHSGHHPKRAGNKMRFAASSAFPTQDGLVQLAASNARQHRRFYEAIGDPEEAKRASLDERYDRYEEKLAAVAEKMKEKTADEWETYFQSRHVPATRVRELREALADPHLENRRVLHRHEDVPGVGTPMTVPLAAFKFAHDGPSIERPPARVGEHTDEVLSAVGYTAAQIAALRTGGAIA